MVSERSRSFLSWGLRFLLAGIFILSAVAKLRGIDRFELYIFSYGFLSLNVSFLLARLCIAVELVLGLFLLAGWYPRWLRLATLGVLIAFSIFLCYAALIGRSDSCQCFGQWMHMDPLLSLLKNAVIIVLVLLHFRWFPLRESTPRWWLPTALALVLATVPFVVSVPDNWMFGIQRLPYDEEALSRSLADEGALSAYGLGEGHRMAAFVTQGCPYCKLAREKMASIVQRHQIDSTRIVYLLPSDLPDGQFIDITYGSRPLLMLLDGREVVATYHYRNIDEKQIATFLKTE